MSCDDLDRGDGSCWWARFARRVGGLNEESRLSVRAVKMDGRICVMLGVRQPASLAGEAEGMHAEVESRREVGPYVVELRRVIPCPMGGDSSRLDSAHQTETYIYLRSLRRKR